MKDLNSQNEQRSWKLLKAYSETNPGTDRDTDMPQVAGTFQQGFHLLEMRNVESQASREHS